MAIDQAVDRPVWAIVPRTDAEREAEALLTLPRPFFEKYRDPEKYSPGPALSAAVNVALLLGQPLLVTGEPGSGKTSLAYWLAQNLGLDGEPDKDGRKPGPLVQVVKSTTTGKDLLYSFDELARFRDASAGDRQSQQTYIELNALGRAILFSAGPKAELVSDGARSSNPAPKPRRGRGAPDNTAEQAAPGRSSPPLRKHEDIYGENFPPKRRSVVLIDELDKAPRDTPNDLLSEIERMEFRIPELGVRVVGDPDHRPVVVITSNSEKSLPDPFLRRCIYYHIPPPDAARRREIVAKQKPAFFDSRLCSDALDLFEGLRNERILGRSPGTAELLAWLDVIETLYDDGAPLLRQPDRLIVSLGTLAKTRDDANRARDEINSRAGKVTARG